MKLLKSLTRLFISFSALFFFHSHLQAQCIVVASADASVVCPGDNVLLSAIGGCGLLMFNNFEDSTLGPGWTTSGGNPTFTNPCGLGPSGIYCWTGSSSDPLRSLETSDFDVTPGGCTVEWYMRYGAQPGNGPCEDPDLPHEGVNLQWSTNGGQAWTNFFGVNEYPEGQNHYTDNGGPPGCDFLGTTTTPGSGGRWEPHGHFTTAMYNNLPQLPPGNNWNYLFWHFYKSPIPLPAVSSNTRFRWVQFTNSGDGFDKWGIDEVEVRCPSGGFDVLWSHGPTTLNPPAVTLYNKDTVPRDTCFTVHVTDTLNSDSDQVCITVKPAPGAQFSVSDTSLCKGDSTTITYMGNGSFLASYTWDIHGLPASGQGPYVRQFMNTGQKTISLEVAEKGCTSATQKTITVHPDPTVSFMTTPYPASAGDTIQFINQSTPTNSSWLWTFGDGNTSTNKSPFHWYNAPGSYPVSLFVESPEGCQNQKENISIHILPGSSIGKASLNDSPIHIYPSPARDIVFVQLPDAAKKVKQVSIFSVNGALIKTVEVQPGQKEFSISLYGMSAGSYVMRIVNNDQAFRQLFKVVN